MVRVLTEKDLDSIDKSNFSEFILLHFKELKALLEQNKISLKDNPLSSDVKVRLDNLLRLLARFVTLAKNDPLAGRIPLEGYSIIGLLKELQENGVRSARLYDNGRKADLHLDVIIKHIEDLRAYVVSRALLRPGNSHTATCYHADFYKTYGFKPSSLPDDYRSNFFFEVKIRELCPYTTLIGFHPFSDVQSSFQDTRSLAALTKIDFDIELRQDEAIEIADNIRALRIHGPSEDKTIPGSYIVVRGGHHRLRALFQKYLLGEVSGDLKILVQKVEIDNFPFSKGDFLGFVNAEIKKRDKIRRIY